MNRLASCADRPPLSRGLEETTEYSDLQSKPRFNMGLVIATGLSTATLFTLFVVPDV